MDLRNEFEKESGQGRYNTEGKEPEENNGTFNDAYVEWLENKVKNLNLFGVSETLISVIGALQDIAIEQGTREVSGADWAKQKVDEFQKLKDKVINSL